jgi:hypothetical protein
MEIEALYAFETSLARHYPQCHGKNHRGKSLKSHDYRHSENGKIVEQPVARIYCCKWHRYNPEAGGRESRYWNDRFLLFAGEVFDVRNAFAGIKPLAYDV